MKYRATVSGTFPAGNHWTEGEVRELDVKADVPPWLVPQPAPKKKAPKAKAKAAPE